MSGVQLEPLIRACERPGQAPFALEEMEHVGAVADVIDRAVGRMILHERLARGALHRPVDRLRKQVHPVAGLLAGACVAEVGVGLLAGQEQDLARRRGACTRRTSPASRAGAAGRDPGDGRRRGTRRDGRSPRPCSLNIADEVGCRPRPALRFLLKSRHGRRHVPVAGERVIARQRRESIAVRVSERLLEGLLGARRCWRSR